MCLSLIKLKVFCYNGKVNTFGIIKCFKSIKKIIIKKILKINNNKVVIDAPYI